MDSSLHEVCHEVVGAISGKHDDAGEGIPRSDFRDDAPYPGGWDTGVREDHQVDCFLRPPFNRVGQYGEGLRNCHIEAMLPENLRETGSDDFLFRDDQDAVDSFTPFKMKAGSRRKAGFLHR